MKFTKAIDLEVISSFNEEKDLVEESSMEHFKEGEEVDADITYEDDMGNIEIQFGDGGVAYCNRSDVEI